MKPDPATIKCRICGNLGHFPSQCPTKNQKSSQKVTHVDQHWSDKDDSKDDSYKTLFVGTYSHVLANDTDSDEEEEQKDIEVFTEEEDDIAESFNTS